MPYDATQLEPVAAAAQALVDACANPDDFEAVDAALAALETASEELKGASEEGMDMSNLGDKSPEEKVSLKAKLAKAAFGG